jgi:hypothetical protein
MSLREWSLMAAVVALAGFTSAPRAQSSRDGALEKPFVAGGHIQLRLEAADYRIVGGSDAARIRVTWHVDRRENATRTGADIQVSGTSAAVVTHSPQDGIHFAIEVPQRSDVDIDLSAGDLELRGIEGNKNVSSWAGDILIDVGKPEQYRRVDATVRFGDLTAQPFNFASGGVWRSFAWSGSGKYSLKVRLFAGDLTFR